MAKWEPAGTVWRKKKASAWPFVVGGVILLIIIGAASG